MKTTLLAEITTVDEAKSFLLALHKNGESFHPEDDATDLSGDPFTMKEGQQLNKLMNDIYNLPGNEDRSNPLFDPCGYLVNLNNHGEDFALICDGVETTFFNLLDFRFSINGGEYEEGPDDYDIDQIKKLKAGESYMLERMSVKRL